MIMILSERPTLNSSSSIRANTHTNYEYVCHFVNYRYCQ